jgi:ADP-ribose pyrophosphatase
LRTHPARHSRYNLDHKELDPAMASYRLIEKQVIYKGKKVHLEVDHLENEETQRQLTREVVIHPGAVVVLPVMSDGRVLMIRNHRYSVRQVLIELPAGTLEKGEDPMNCAGRELLEETGYLAGKLQRIGAFYSSPGILTEKLYAFAAYHLEKKSAALEEDEEIEIMPVLLDDALKMIDTAEIMDAKTIATLLMYERSHRAQT